MLFVYNDTERNKGGNMEYKQYDIFGNLVEPPTPKKGGRGKYKTMQEMYGIKEGLTCKTCKHCIATGYNRTYYKCDLWIMSSSEATDIRLKNKACKKWEFDYGRK